LWAGAVALPFQLGLLVVVRRTLYRDWTGPTRRPSVAAQLTLAVLAWAVLAPTVLIFNQVVIDLLSRLGGSPEVHPLARLTGLRPVLDQILFLFRACVAAPLVEEILFRGMLLPWLLGGRHRVVTALIVAVLLAAFIARQSGPWIEVATRGPVLFAEALAVGYAVLIRLARRRVRTVGAVYASAAVFAAVHSTVWPDPVALFVLGLGLGYLAVRTRGVLVPAVVHALFNAVSALFVMTS
jgi:membrane protease YdiL (CAAX protease family)